jgi:transaldolase
MKFFIDTANLEQIAKAQDMGILDGVTIFFVGIDYIFN